MILHRDAEIPLQLRIGRKSLRSEVDTAKAAFLPLPAVNPARLGLDAISPDEVIARQHL